MLKRYLVFAGGDYCSNGGFEDLVESFATKKEAMQYIEDNVGGDAPNNIGKDFYWEWGQLMEQDTEDKWYYDTFNNDKYSWEQML